jgi:hypothetical protein
MFGLCSSPVLTSPYSSSLDDPATNTEV